MKKILIPVDNLESCSKTMEIGKDLALKYNAEIVILHVQQSIEDQFYSYTKACARLTQKECEELLDLSRESVINASKDFEGLGLTVSMEVVMGNPASEIIDYAEHNDCDMIIICSHGYGSIKRFLLGSVTSKVVHHATIPVLVVR